MIVLWRARIEGGKGCDDGEEESWTERDGEEEEEEEERGTFGRRRSRLTLAVVNAPLSYLPYGCGYAGGAAIRAPSGPRYDVSYGMFAVRYVQVCMSMY